jgi:Protein of unknown function (DUF4236)
MGFNFRKKIGPLNISLSQRGLNTSVGAGGFRVGVSPTGKRYVNVDTGRGGLRYRKRVTLGNESQLPFADWTLKDFGYALAGLVILGLIWYVKFLFKLYVVLSAIFTVVFVCMSPIPPPPPGFPPELIGPLIAWGIFSLALTLFWITRRLYRRWFSRTDGEEG